jgi:hypothetical protein
LEALNLGEHTQHSVIEYICGTTLVNYKAGKLNISSAIFRPLLSLVDAINKFKDLGVYHGNISGGRNILVSLSSVPPRAVLVNFGHATAGRQAAFFFTLMRTR